MSKDDFAASLERSGDAAFQFAERYLKKMSEMMDREIGSTKIDSGQELLDYARVRHDPTLLRQAFLEPLRARLGKGRGNEAFVKWIGDIERRLYATDGTD